MLNADVSLRISADTIEGVGVDRGAPTALSQPVMKVGSPFFQADYMATPSVPRRVMQTVSLILKANYN